MNHRSGSHREAGGKIFCTLADRVRRQERGRPNRRTMPYTHYTREDIIPTDSLCLSTADAIFPHPSLPFPPPRLVRQHRVRRSGQLPSGHTGRCHLEVFAPIRAVVDGRSVDIRPGSVRAPRVPFQPHPLAGAGAGASLEEGEVLPLGRRRVLDDHHRPPDRRRIRHVREEGFSSSYTRYFPIDRPRALPHCLWYILTYIDHNIFHRSQFSAVNYFFGLP